MFGGPRLERPQQVRPDPLASAADADEQVREPPDARARTPDRDADDLPTAASRDGDVLALDRGAQFAAVEQRPLAVEERLGLEVRVLG